MANVFEDKLNLVREFASQSGMQDNVLSVLSAPEQVVKINLPVKMDDGRIEIFTAYRSRYSTLLGPAKGGIRYHEAVDEDLINTLSLGMMLKNSLVGLPYGGAKGGVKVDASKLSQNEIERLSRAYMKAMAPYVGPYLDVPAPDIATNSTIMGYMIDEYESFIGHKCPAVITGKPISAGGSAFRTEATGFGAYLVTKLLIEKLGKSIKDTTVAVQGFGNVGYYLANFLQEEGFKVVAVSDIKGSIYKKDGIDIKTLSDNFNKSKDKNKSVVDADISGKLGVSFLSNAQLLVLDVDVLIPASVNGVITLDNVNDIKAKYIVEGANSPTTKDANDILENRGIIVLPDILCNAGGVSVSYFEWVQNLQYFWWTEIEVKQKLTTIMTNAFNNVWEVKEKHNKSMVAAAYHVSLNRLQNAAKAKLNI